MIARASLALAAALLTASCGSPLMTLPGGPGTPVPDGPNVLNQALATCRGAQTVSAEVAISGKVGGRRIRGRLLAGVSSPASAYLDAPAPFGASVFIFAAVNDDATLLLPRERRVLEHGRPADVLEAVTGIALTPQQLRATLTGCVETVGAGGAQQLGDAWRMIPGSPAIYVRRERPADSWRVVALVHRAEGRPQWRAEYRDFTGNLPRTIRLTSDDPKRFDLQLTLSQVEINAPLESSVFRPAIPQGYAPVSLEQLRDVGPLAESSSSR